MKLLSAVLAATVISAPVLAKEKAPPPAEPTTNPSWAEARAKGQANLVSGLFDPASAQIVYTSGFAWGWTKALFGKKRYAWVACGTLNAKNRMGGYVGAKPFYVSVDEAGTVMSDYDGLQGASCYQQTTPLQPELQEGTSTTPAIAGSNLSIADELGKLADLKAKGVITDEEFAAQKAKLLAR